MKRNKLEIRVCGLQRSGNHAIINWIIGQHKEKKVCFLNNVRHGDYNPFYTAREIFVYNIEKFPDGQIYQQLISDDVNLLQNLQSIPKDLLVFSYEDDNNCLKKNTEILNSFYSQEFSQKRTCYLGESEQRIDAIIIRDPYNFLASRLKRREQLTGIKDIDTIVKFWKDIAQEAIRLEENPEPSKIVFNYNRWFSDKKYRRQLSHKLGGTFDDSSTKVVSSIGGGSSFDGLNFSGDLKNSDIFSKWKKLFQLDTYYKLDKYLKMLQGAKKMKVLERWKEVDDSEMQKILLDQEITTFSQILFGDVTSRNIFSP